VNRLALVKLPVLPAETPEVPLTSVAEVVRLLGETMNQVRTGRLAVNVGNCLGVLATVLLRALEGDSVMQRVAAIEARLKGNP
jgi:hypothetical protein